jgi:hypothetical protein
MGSLIVYLCGIHLRMLRQLKCVLTHMHLIKKNQNYTKLTFIIWAEPKILLHMGHFCLFLL